MLDGKVFDLINNICKAKLNATGKCLTLCGRVGVSVIGRSVTWLKY